MQNLINDQTKELMAQARKQANERIIRNAIVEAAQDKFNGVVERIKEGFSYGEYTLIIKRNVNLFGADRCYMRIRGAISPDTGLPMFYWGHYDLSEESAYKD